MDIERIYKEIEKERDYYNDLYNHWEEQKNSPYYVRESNFNEGWVMGLGFALDLIGKEMRKETHGEPFLDDECKMVDFLALNKEQFLASYSYLTSEDWNATYIEMLKMLNKRGFSITFEEELDGEACKYSVNGECAVCNKPCDGTTCTW